jgi:hypothetical protein
MERVLASVEVIKDIKPIDGADKIYYQTKQQFIEKFII